MNPDKPSTERQPLNDESPMPFGIHAGLAMKKIPVNYFHYLWQRGLKSRSHTQVGDYIKSKTETWKVSDPGYHWD